MVNFEEAPMFRAMPHFFLPMILGMSVNVIYSVVNAYILGLLHHASMLGSPIIISTILFNQQASLEHAHVVASFGISLRLVLQHAGGVNGLFAALPVTEVLTFLIGLIQLISLPIRRLRTV